MESILPDTAAPSETILSTNDSSNPKVPSELSKMSHAHKPSSASSRSLKTAPLSPTSNRRPALLVVNTRQQSSGDRYDHTPSRKYSTSSGSFASLNSPPVSPRTLQPMRTQSPSPPLILTSIGLSPIPSSPSSPISPSLEPSLLPYQSCQASAGKNQGSPTSSPIRRAPSIESPPVRDPYRFRTSSISSRGVKNDYQTQGHTQTQVHSGVRHQSPTNSGYGGYRASEEHQRADYSPNSPTLSDNQTLLSRPVGSGGMPGGNSPFQAYLPVQQQSYSPHQSSSHIPTQDRQDYRVDPYRSAYSQHQHHQQQFQQMQQQGSFSPYHGTSVPLEDSYNSRHSLSSSNGASMSGGQRYPMRTLHSHDSNQHSQGGATPASSEFGGGRSDRYQDLEDGSLIGTTNRQSSAMQHQYSLADSNPSVGHRVKDREEEDENAEILTSDKKSKNKKTNKFIPVDDDEEGQERGEMRYRDPKRCWCCSRRQCVYISFVLLICLAVVLYFVIPRPPVFAFISVASMGDPVIAAGEVQEPFSIQLQVDSSSNYVPLRINSVDMSMWMKIDMTNIGNNNGLSSSFTIKPRTIQSVSLPMMIDYTSLMIDTNADGTYQDLIAACTPISSSSGVTSLGLNLIFGGKLYISGLSWIWKPQFSFSAENVPCPVNANVTSTSTQTSTSTTGTGAVNTTTSVSQTSTASTTVGRSSSQTGMTLSATSTASSTSAARTPTQTV